MMFDNELASLVVNRVLGVSRPRKIIIFLPCNDGEGESRTGVLVLQDQIKRGEWESIRIQASLQGLGRAFDVLVMGTDYFEQARDILGSPAWPAASYGRIVYPAAKAPERVRETESGAGDPGPSDAASTPAHNATPPAGHVLPAMME